MKNVRMCVFTSAWLIISTIVCSACATVKKTNHSCVLHEFVYEKHLITDFSEAELDDAIIANNVASVLVSTGNIYNMHILMRIKEK